MSLTSEQKLWEPPGSFPSAMRLEMFQIEAVPSAWIPEQTDTSEAELLLTGEG